LGGQPAYFAEHKPGTLVVYDDVQRAKIVEEREHRNCTGTALVIEGPIRSALLKAVTDLPDLLGCERDETSDLRGADTLHHLDQNVGTKDGSDRLNAAAEEGPQLLVIF